MKNISLLIILALVIRIILAFSTFHSDIQAFNLAGKIVGEGHILNLYDYLPSLPDSNTLKNIAVLNYPPSIYLFEGIFNFLFKIVGLPINQFLLNDSANYGNILFNINLLVLKMPYLIFDLLTAFVLFKLFKERRQANLALILWLFNPLNLYATYMMGQFDIIPTFFTLLSIFYIVTNRLNLAAISLGGGIAFKLYPIFLLIPLMISAKNLWERSRVVSLALIPYIVTILPYLSSENFRSTALFASQSSKSLYASIPISGGESLILFPTLLLLFYFVISNLPKLMETWKLYLIPFLLFFIFTHYHPQWLIWVAPFLILSLVTNLKNILPIGLILITWFASLFFFEPSLTIGLFAPIAPHLRNAPGILTLLNINLDYNLARSIIQTIFASSALYLIYQYFLRKINV